MNKVLAVLAVVVVGLGACASQNKAGSPGVVNSKCPIKSDRPLPPLDGQTQAVTADHKGQTVRFCCKGCVAKWEKLSEGDKDARLSAAR
jgi:hypothetical protein